MKASAHTEIITVRTIIAGKASPVLTVPLELFVELPLSFVAIPFEALS